MDYENDKEGQAKEGSQPTSLKNMQLNTQSEKEVFQPSIQTGGVLKGGTTTGESNKQMTANAQNTGSRSSNVQSSPQKASNESISRKGESKKKGVKEESEEFEEDFSESIPTQNNKSDMEKAWKKGEERFEKLNEATPMKGSINEEV